VVDGLLLGPILVCHCYLCLPESIPSLIKALNFGEVVCIHLSSISCVPHITNFGQNIYIYIYMHKNMKNPKKTKKKKDLGGLPSQSADIRCLFLGFGLSIISLM
jgi:hypothetical protein